MPFGVACGIWAALGAALTTVASRVQFKEPLNWIMTIEIALIIGGVLLVETGVAHQGAAITLHDGGMASGVVPGSDDSR